MKKKLALLFILALVLSSFMIIGCSNGATTTTTAEPGETTTSDDTDETTTEGETGDDNGEDEQEVEIRVSWWGDTNRHNLYNQIIDAFEDDNPGITAVREPVSWADYWDKMTVQTAGDAAPDFIGMHPMFVSDYLRRDVLEPLDQYVDAGVLDLSDFSQGALESGMSDGTVYMVAMGLTLQARIIDETNFNDLGVTIPDFDWTWDDLVEIAQEAREAFDNEGQNNNWLIGDGSGDYQGFRYWARQRGGDLNTVDGDIGYTVEHVESWFSFWKDLRDQNLIPDAASTTEFSGVTLEDGMFARGRVLVSGLPANQYKLHAALRPENEMSLVRSPTLSGDENGEFTEGAHFAVFSRTSEDKKLAAAKLINFWVNTEESISLFRLDQGVPANTRMAELIEPTLDEGDRIVLDFVNTTAALGSASPFPPAGASEVNALYLQYAERVRFDDMSPQDAAEELVAEAQAIIDSNR